MRSCKGFAFGERQNAAERAVHWWLGPGTCGRPLPFQMAAQMKPGERKQEGGGFWAGHGVGVQDGLWFGGSAQPQSVLPQSRFGNLGTAPHFF